jgi:hypothetical protein
MLLYVFGIGLLMKLVLAQAHRNATSLADLIATARQEFARWRQR